MLRSNDELLQMREWALTQHRGWKQRSLTSDLIVQKKWSVLWPDLTIDESEPLVEDAYTVALEDKSAAAAMIEPFVDVPPIRGTKVDRAERSAQRKRRVMLSHMQRSNIPESQIQLYLDWYQHGVMFGSPWCDWQAAPRYPFALRWDPRHVYPVAHNSKGDLTVAIVTKLRRVVDLEHDYGPHNQALAQIKARRMRNRTDPQRAIEEVWYMDEKEWGIALVDTDEPDKTSRFRYVSPTRHQVASFVSWVVMDEHRLEACPMVESKRATADGEYRGALDGMIPNLRVAHNLMARLLDDVERNTFAPKILDNILNPEDWGPDAILIGDGKGQARVEYARPPMNFEGFQHAQFQVDAAKQAGKYPQQRSGDFGASIASAKATVSVMGAFNTEQAWAQRDTARFYRTLLQRIARFDKEWCPGPKQVDGIDEGEAYTERYDARDFYRDDYRVWVGFHAVGLDEQQHLTRLAVAKNMRGLARRSFMRKSGLVSNPLQEEREIALEETTDGYLAFMQQQAAAGNLQPLQVFAERIDSDDFTIRSAVMESIKEAVAVNSDGQTGGLAGPGDPGAALQQIGSLNAGGIPGQAEGLPSIGPALQSLLPSGPRRALSETAPGGTAI